MSELIDVIGTETRPNCNPYFHWGDGYEVNCQTAVVVAEMRFRGLSVEAMPLGDVGEILAQDPRQAFIDKDTETTPDLYLFEDWAYIENEEAYADLFDGFKELVRAGQRWCLEWDWPDDDTGHIIMVMGDDDGNLVLIDPQDGTKVVGVDRFYSEYFERCGSIVSPSMFRVDDTDLNPLIVGAIRNEGERVQW